MFLSSTSLVIAVTVAVVVKATGSLNKRTAGGKGAMSSVRVVAVATTRRTPTMAIVDNDGSGRDGYEDGDGEVLLLARRS